MRQKERQLIKAVSSQPPRRAPGMTPQRNSANLWEHGSLRYLAHVRQALREFDTDFCESEPRGCSGLLTVRSWLPLAQVGQPAPALGQRWVRDAAAGGSPRLQHMDGCKWAAESICCRASRVQLLENQNRACHRPETELQAGRPLPGSHANITCLVTCPRLPPARYPSFQIPGPRQKQARQLYAGCQGVGRGKALFELISTVGGRALNPTSVVLRWGAVRVGKAMGKEP